MNLLKEQVANLRVESNDLGVKYENLRASVETLRREVAVIQQQIAELNKRADAWDRRMWGLVVVLIGALLSLASGLIVTLVKI